MTSSFQGTLKKDDFFKYFRQVDSPGEEKIDLLLNEEGGKGEKDGKKEVTITLEEMYDLGTLGDFRYAYYDNKLIDLPITTFDNAKTGFEENEKDHDETLYKKIWNIWRKSGTSNDLDKLEKNLQKIYEIKKSFYNLEIENYNETINGFIEKIKQKIERIKAEEAAEAEAAARAAAEAEAAARAAAEEAARAAAEEAVRAAAEEAARVAAEAAEAARAAAARVAAARVAAEAEATGGGAAEAEAAARAAAARVAAARVAAEAEATGGGAAEAEAAARAAAEAEAAARVAAEAEATGGAAEAAARVAAEAAEEAARVAAEAAEATGGGAAEAEAVEAAEAAARVAAEAAEAARAEAAKAAKAAYERDSADLARWAAQHEENRNAPGPYARYRPLCSWVQAPYMKLKNHLGAKSDFSQSSFTELPDANISCIVDRLCVDLTNLGSLRIPNLSDPSPFPEEPYRELVFYAFLSKVTTKRGIEQTMLGDNDGKDTTEWTAEILRLVAEGVEARRSELPDLPDLYDMFRAMMTAQCGFIGGYYDAASFSAKDLGPGLFQSPEGYAEDCEKLLTRVRLYCRVQERRNKPDLLLKVAEGLLNMSDHWEHIGLTCKGPAHRTY